MEPRAASKGGDAAPEGTDQDGDFYYTKALNYLAGSSTSSTPENAQSDNDSCSGSSCPRCSSSSEGSKDHNDNDGDDDHHDFALGFRRGLTKEQTEDSPSSDSSSGSSSPRGIEVPGGNRQRSGSTCSQTSSCSASSSSPPKRWERKCSIGGRFYKTGSGAAEFGKIEPKRKMSDGHVHWADEFHKELIRCHPRKTYSRHPSHLASQVKPILKLSHEECDQC